MKKRTQITFPDISHKKQMIIYTFDIYFVKPILKGLFIILLNHCLILLVLQKAIGNGHRKITWYGPSRLYQLVAPLVMSIPTSVQ